MASRATAPALSRTPGLKPTHTAQSKAWAKGRNPEVWVMGCVKTSRRTSSSSPAGKSRSSIRTLSTRTRSISRPQYSRAWRRTPSPSASGSSGRQPISKRTAIFSPR